MDEGIPRFRRLTDPPDYLRLWAIAAYKSTAFDPFLIKEHRQEPDSSRANSRENEREDAEFVHSGMAFARATDNRACCPGNDREQPSLALDGHLSCRANNRRLHVIRYAILTVALGKCGNRRLWLQ